MSLAPLWILLSLPFSPPPYLPYQFTADGCYARTFFISMELAAEGKLPHAIVAVGEFEVWGRLLSFHMAPVEPSERTRWIWDPSLSKMPIAEADWLKGLHPTRPPEVFVIAGSRYLGNEEPPDLTRSEIFSEAKSFPPFSFRDIEAACQDLREKWEMLEFPSPFVPTSDEALAEAKKQKTLLIKRASELVAILEKQKLLKDRPTHRSLECEESAE